LWAGAGYFVCDNRALSHSRHTAKARKPQGGAGFGVQGSESSIRPYSAQSVELPVADSAGNGRHPFPSPDRGRNAGRTGAIRPKRQNPLLAIQIQDDAEALSSVTLSSGLSDSPASWNQPKTTAEQTARLCTR